MDSLPVPLNSAHQIRSGSPPVRPASWADTFSGSCPAFIGGVAVSLLCCDDIEVLVKDAEIFEVPCHPCGTISNETPRNRSNGLRNSKSAARRGSAIIFRSPKSMAEWARKSFMSFRVDLKEENSKQNFGGKKSSGTSAFEDLKSLDFDIFNHNSDDLVEICLKIFTELDLGSKLGIKLEAFRSFVLSVRSRMLANPYHNWYHVVDVTQTVYTLAWQSQLLGLMSDQEKLALIVAALCHDLEHPGVTSAFLIETCSVLAAQYGMDIALLEKHHSSCASELMTNAAGTGLLDSMDADTRQETVARVQSLIFATDMSRHGEYAAHLQCMLEERDRRAAARTALLNTRDEPDLENQGPMEQGTADIRRRGDHAVQSHCACEAESGRCHSPAHAPASTKEEGESIVISDEESPANRTTRNSPAVELLREPEDRATSADGACPLELQGDRGAVDASGAKPPVDEALVPVLAELLLKAADMSNVVKAFPIAKQWAMRVTDEFFQQGDLEQSMGLAVTPACDRRTQSRVALQRSFTAFVAPFYAAVGDLLPGLRPAAERLAATRAGWDAYDSDAALLAEFDRTE